MQENRRGGTLDTASVPGGGEFQQNQDTQRADFGFVFDTPLNENLNLNLRGSIMDQTHEHQFGAVFEDDNHKSWLVESSLSGFGDNLAWLIGTAYQAESFDSEAFPLFDYNYEIPGLFSQVDYDIRDNLAMSVSARADWHSEYGTQFSPRVSVLYRPENWTFRGAFGQGYFAPTPFIEEIDDAGLSRLAPLRELEAEQATTASMDISYITNSLETSMTLFRSEVENVTELQVIPESAVTDTKVQLVNVGGETEISGAELLLRYRWRDIKFTGSYLYTDASKPGEGQSNRIPLALTPRHSAGLVIMWEEHGSHLLGFEAYYTGTQHLEGNPYRDLSEPYWHLGLLGQITTGRVSWFLNAENLLNIRQTREEPLLLMQQAASGRWTTDIWSRNDGFTVNAGFRVQFGS